MVELGQLEKIHEEFSHRKVKIYAISTDKLEDAKTTQQKFPHLVIVSDEGQSLSKAADAIGKHQAPDGREVVSPTTILIDRTGKVRHVFRPDTFVVRLSGQDVLNLAAKHFSR